MTFSSLRSLRTTPISHQDRALTVVFGSDGQVSLIGFDGGSVSQAPYTLTVSNALTGTLTSGTPPPSKSTPTSLIPNLEATSVSLTGAVSGFTPTSSLPSSLASSSYDPSSTTTDTNTYLPSIPTVNYPTPSPTPVSNSKDQVGAPFYLAMVLASISFVGCVAAFIAWLIRSRTRRRDLEYDDPWIHGDTVSDKGNPKGETQTKPYYLPASIVRRISSNLLAVPHTTPAVEDVTSHIPRPAALDAGRYPSLGRENDPYSQSMPSLQTTNQYSRPGAERLQSGISVQESTRTLGRLRVANRMPGDVTSGDEGGLSVPRLQNGAGLSSTGRPDAVPVGESVVQGPYSDRSGRSVQEGDGPLEPPGPATLSWGRRTDTVAALRRTRRRAPETTTLQTYKNSEYLYPRSDGGPSGTMPQALAVDGPKDNEKAHAIATTFDPLSWKNTLKSSFWQAVDAMTGNRPLDPEPLVANDGGSGSRFTPAPQRVASRRSPVSPTSQAGSAHPGTHAVRSQATETKYDFTPPNRPVAAQEIPLDSTYSSFVGSLAGQGDSGLPPISEATLSSVASLPPILSHLYSNISENRRHPDSLKTDTGSVYSTESAVARANLRKYGYADSIPSTWSALGASRESQLSLEPIFLPLPRPISSSPHPLSVTPSQLTLASSLLSSSVSTRTRTRTPAHSESDLIGSDISILRSNEHRNTASHSETASFMDSVSRNGTIQSERGTIGHGTAPSHLSSTTSSTLSRKKGVTTRRKRPKLPPRAPSSASSVQTLESGLSIREVAVRKALLERRRKVKAAGSIRSREDSLTRSRDGSSFLV